MSKHDLPPALDDLGHQLRAAAERELEPAARPARRRRRLRYGLLAGLLIGGTVGGVAIGGDLLGVGAPIQKENDALERVRPSVAPQAAVVVDDPQGGPAWGAAPYTAKDGRDCVIAGRQVGGRLGVRGADGIFRAFPARNAGACGRLENSPIVLEVLDPPDEFPRTLVYGRVAPDRRRIVIRTDAGETTIVRPGPDGVFLAVYRGRLRPQDFSVSARTR